MQSIDAILRVLHMMEKECGTDDFAYLIATSKAEGPFRDQFAYRLHVELSRTNKIVAREWTPRGSRKRIDVAILDKSGTPETLIELKAMYMFDGMRGGEDSIGTFEINVKEDIRKAAAVCNGYTTKIFGLLLASHIGTKVPPELARVVKYADDINTALDHYGDTMLARVAEKAPKALSPLRIVSSGVVGGGLAFSVFPHVHYWLVKA